MVGAPVSLKDQRATSAKVERPVGASMQLIAFKIGASLYGVDIMVVHEIRVWTETQSLPHTPHYVRGVINLRGVIVPIFDLRDRFGQGRTEPTNKHVVIVVTVQGRTVGLLVDAVSDILTVYESEIRPVPDAAGSDHAFLRGLVSVGEDMVSLIEPLRLFSTEALQVAERVTVKELEEIKPSSR